MRTPLLLILLALAAGGMLWLVLGQELPVDDESDLSAGEERSAGTKEPAPARGAVRSPIEVVPADEWPASIDAAPNVPLHGDPRLRQASEVAMPVDEEWTPTGGQVLDILARELAGKAVVRFRNQKALDDFRASTWTEIVPGKFPLVLLLESCHGIGFRPVMRPEGVYLLRLSETPADG